MKYNKSNYPCVGERINFFEIKSLPFIKRRVNDPKSRTDSYITCRCVCGETLDVLLHTLDRVKSCGCQQPRLQSENTRKYKRCGTLMKDGKKVCVSCELEKSSKEFSKDKRKTDGYQTYCKECSKLKNIYRYYKLDKESYNKLVQSQNGKCACCKENLEGTDRPCIDHCHTTGVVRGILCKKCNFGIGCFDDNKEKLYSAIKYLENNYSHK